jgi:hypothetical protein
MTGKAPFSVDYGCGEDLKSDISYDPQADNQLKALQFAYLLIIVPDAWRTIALPQMPAVLEVIQKKVSIPCYL